jgi:hypothetical protein
MVLSTTLTTKKKHFKFTLKFSQIQFSDTLRNLGAPENANVYLVYGLRRHCQFKEFGAPEMFLGLFVTRHFIKWNLLFTFFSRSIRISANYGSRRSRGKFLYFSSQIFIKSIFSLKMLQRYPPIN